MKQEKKIYFYRDNSNESEEAKKALDEKHVNYIEIYTASDRELPCLIPSGSAIPYCGSDGINLFLSFISESANGTSVK